MREVALSQQLISQRRHAQHVQLRRGANVINDVLAGCHRRCEDRAFVGHDAHSGQTLHIHGRRCHRVVGRKAKRQSAVMQFVEKVLRTGQGLGTSIQHAVHVEDPAGRVAQSLDRILLRSHSPSRENFAESWRRLWRRQGSMRHDTSGVHRRVPASRSTRSIRRTAEQTRHAPRRSANRTGPWSRPRSRPRYAAGRERAHEASRRRYRRRAAKLMTPRRYDGMSAASRSTAAMSSGSASLGRPISTAHRSAISPDAVAQSVSPPANTINDESALSPISWSIERSLNERAGSDLMVPANSCPRLRLEKPAERTCRSCQVHERLQVRYDSGLTT